MNDQENNQESQEKSAAQYTMEALAAKRSADNLTFFSQLVAEARNVVGDDLNALPATQDATPAQIAAIARMTYALVQLVALGIIPDNHAIVRAFDERVPLDELLRIAERAQGQARRQWVGAVCMANWTVEHP